MSVIVEFTVPADAFTLSETLDETPEMIIEIERVVAHDENRVMPYFWIRGGNYTAFETAVTDDPTVQNVETRRVQGRDALSGRVDPEHREYRLRVSRNRSDHRRGGRTGRQLGAPDAVR